MDFNVDYLSFFVVKVEGEGDQATKTYKHYQTLDDQGYAESNLKWFLDGELMRTLKRKAERNPKSENAATKIGRFIAEQGYGLDSNPNYNLFAKLRHAQARDEYKAASDDLVRAYLDTSAIRGGALIVARGKWNKYFDDPFLFIFKCDFETKIASIADEHKLIEQVEMAINAKNIKSIQYPHMPEEGMLSDWELKIFQSSHARYFEDFLKYVDYEQSIPEMMNTQVIGMVQQFIEDTYTDNEEQKQKEEEDLDIWVGKKERDLQEKWTHEQVAEAAQILIEQKPDLEMKFKLDEVQIKAMLSHYGDSLHLAKVGSRYVVLIEGDSFQFDKGVSPVELLRPDQLEKVLDRIARKQELQQNREAAATIEASELPF